MCKAARYTRRSTNNRLKFFGQKAMPYFCNPLVLYKLAEVAHLVEHDLAKVGVAGSSPVFRSASPPSWRIFFHCPGGGIGRHAGLKILWPAMAVTVQLRSGAQLKATHVAFVVYTR